MKIFSSAQIKKWDAFTIASQPILSIDLMERAAVKCVDWIAKQHYQQQHVKIFCGKGNNGADGLAIARLLIEREYVVTVYILEFGHIGTADFQSNLVRLHACCTDIHFIQSKDFFPAINKTDIIIDALFGIGLNKPLDNIAVLLVNYINQFNATVIAIDLPSGLFADISSKKYAVIKATHTLSFQSLKLAFLLPENEKYVGNLHILDIELDKSFGENEVATFELVEKKDIQFIYKPRSQFSHKGNWGHAALLCGSYGMMGAAVLSAKACMQSGVGKLTCYIPKCGYQILQTTIPEAMCVCTGKEFIVTANHINKFDAVAIGCGIGLHITHANLLKEIFGKINSPLLLDADALNTIANDKTLLELLPANSIITPHPKEFENLFGKVDNDFDRLQLCLKKSKKYNIFIILKGHFTFIATPSGNGYFNSTGNAGMATAGSGDVLSGIITGLLAQKYLPLQSCLMGVFLHGLAGDIAAKKISEEALIASDIITYLGKAFKILSA